MKKAPLLPLLAILGMVLVAAWLLFDNREPERETAVGGVASGVSEPVAAPAGQEEPVRPSEASSTDRVSLELPDWPLTSTPLAIEIGIPSFRGRVVQPDGEAAPKARIQAFGLRGWAVAVDPDDPNTRPLVAWEIQCDERGRFQLPESPHQDLRFLIRTRFGGFPPLELTNVRATPGRTRELGDLRLNTGFTASGTVRDASGRPVAGALVEPLPEPEEAAVRRWLRRLARPIEGYQARTDAGGVFRFDALPPGRLRFRATAIEYAPGYSNSAKGDNEAELTEIEIELAPASALTGIVLDDLRQPVPSALVRSYLSGREKIETLTGEDGRFRLDPPTEMSRLVVEALADGFWPAFLSLDEELRALPLEVVLEPMPNLQGVVLDAAGQPVAEADVRLVEWRRARELSGSPAGIRSVAQTNSSDDGSFELHVDLRRVSDPRTAIVVWSPEYAPGRSGQIALDDRNKYPQERIEIRLQTGTTIRGRVLGPDEQAYARARLHLRQLVGQRGPVEVSGETRSQRNGIVYQRGDSDEEGTFEFRGVPDGDYQIEAYAPGLSPAVSEVLTVQGQPHQVELRLPRNSILEGRVVGDVSGFRSLRVRASSPTARAIDTAVDGNQYFRFEGLVPGTYTVILREEDPSRTTLGFGGSPALELARQNKIEVPPGATTEVRLELDLGERAELHGVVRVNGDAVPEYGVYLVPELEGTQATDPRRAMREHHQRLRSTSTDYRGEYRLPAIEPGNYWLVIDRPNAWPEGVFRIATDGAGPTGLARQRVVLAPGKSTRQDFQLLVGSFVGRVFRMKNGKRVDERRAQGSLSPGPGMEGVADRRIDVRRGRFRLEGVPAGTYELTIRSGSFEVRKSAITILAGDRSTEDFQLQRRSEESMPRIR